MHTYYRGSVITLSILFLFSVFGSNSLFISVAVAATRPDLGVASSFAVLAGSGITSTNPPQVIMGDVGSDPTISNGLTGVEVTGINYTAADAVVIAAKVDAALAYQQALLQPQSGTDIPSELSGQTLLPGVYHSADGTFEIAGAGVLTLDGGGDSNAVFIIKADTTLTTGGASSIVLINDAQAHNIFWVVGTSATLDNTNFFGTIMAEASITDSGNSTIVGKLLADAENNGTGAVTLNNTNITNSVLPTTLTLNNIVVNDAGGDAVESDWTLTATGPTSFSGPGAAGATDVVSDTDFLPGEYTLTQSIGSPGYLSSSWSCITNGGAPVVGALVTLDIGDTVVCTIIQQDIAPQLIVNKIVINDNGRTKVVSDFDLFVDGMSIVSGVVTTTNVGLHTVSEGNDTQYTAVIGGDCASNGTITLALGDVKTCTITNDDIVRTSGGGSYYPPVPPIIDVLKVPSPLVLPNGPGLVLYTYTLRNIGTVPVTQVTMVGDTCSPIILVSGDTNLDARLDVNEVWVHTCSTTLTETHTNIVTAMGWANGISATDIASATVIVGMPVVPPLINVTKVPSPLTLLSGGGMVTYTNKVTNPGTEPLTTVRLSDDKCSPVRYISGDTNGDARLDRSEIWTYTCTSDITQTTVNTVTASGMANGLTATDFAIVTMIVPAPNTVVAPKLPDTGSGVPYNSLPWRIVVSTGIVMLVGSLHLVRKKYIVR